MKYTCHSGGCQGADMTWENEGMKYDVHTIAYSFWNHKQEGRNQKILSGVELAEGFQAVLRANKVMKRYPQGQPQYVQNLLARNWFQVKNSDAVFAIAKKLLTERTVDGGTGWAVQMAIDCDKPVFIFLQDDMMISGYWLRYMPIVGFESLRGEIPTLTENFAGIGTRALDKSGINAIKEIYKKNFTGM
jgi:hypothetical protein